MCDSDGHSEKTQKTPGSGATEAPDPQNIERKEAYRGLLALRGSYTPSIPLKILRDDR